MNRYRVKFKNGNEFSITAKSEDEAIGRIVLEHPGYIYQDVESIRIDKELKLGDYKTI
jgi:hypothetical protein